MNLWLAGLFGGLFLFGAAQVRKLEASAERSVAVHLEGEAKQVRVRIRPAGISGALASATITASGFSVQGLPFGLEPDRSTRGKIHELRLEMSDFHLRRLRVESLKVKIPDCRFDYSAAQRKGELHLTRSGVGTGVVTVLEEDLRDYLLNKYPGIDRLSIQVRGDTMRVQGYGSLFVAKGEFDVHANMAVGDGIRLMLTNTEASLDGKPMEDRTVKLLEQALNPVLDLNRDLRLNGAMHIQRIESGNGRIVGYGTATIPPSPSVEEDLARW